MGRRNPFEVEDVSDMVDDLIAGAPSPIQSNESERKTPRTPHEDGRTGRKVTIDLASAAWPEAARDLAKSWGVRPCDVWTYALACLMRAVEDGMDPPLKTESKFYHRAGEMMDLPWEPEED